LTPPFVGSNPATPGFEIATKFGPQKGCLSVAKLA